MAVVLIALDESPVSLRAAREARRLFDRPDDEFLVINVGRVDMPWLVSAPPGAVVPMHLDWDQLIPERDPAEVAELAVRAGLPEAEALAELGDPVNRICEAADEHDADVVVVGSHDKGLLARLFDPSVSAGVIRRTSRPVLVVSGEPAEDS